MRVLSVDGSKFQIPVTNPIFEEAIGDQNPHYTKIVPPKGDKSDEIQVDAYTLHVFGSVLMDLPAAKFWEEMEGVNGPYLFSTKERVTVHLTGGLMPTGGLTQVRAELRVKASYPTNRPIGAKEPNVSYALVLELSPATGDFDGQLVIEKSSTGSKDRPLLDSSREIFAAYWSCVKRLQLGTASRDQIQPRQQTRPQSRPPVPQRPARRIHWDDNSR